MSQRTPISKDELHQKALEARAFTQGFDVLADHVVVTDPEGNVIYANKAALHKTGFSEDEVLGKNPGDLWGGNMDEDIYKSMWRTIKSEKQAWHGEVKNKRKDGTEYWQDLRVNPILSDDGDVEYFVGIEPDITGQKMAQDSLLHAMSELKSLNGFYEGRELKMMELKTAVSELSEELNRYKEIEDLDPEEHD